MLRQEFMSPMTPLRPMNRAVDGQTTLHAHADGVAVKQSASIRDVIAPTFRTAVT